MNKETDRMLHVAVQYLAVAGINYLAKKDDDSHTNLCWDYYTSSYSTRQFENGDILFFHPSEMRLHWSGDKRQELNLVGLSHAEVVVRLDQIAKENGHKGYTFKLHYELDSGPIRDDYRFEHPSLERIAIINSYRDKAQKACTNTISRLGMTQDIRVWPHHFDTGAFVALEGDTGVSVGFGLGIPDEQNNDYYLYAAAYKGHDNVPTTSFAEITCGGWLDAKWKGAKLMVKGCTQEEYDQFFVEALKAFSNVE